MTTPNYLSDNVLDDVSDDVLYYIPDDFMGDVSK